MAFTSAGVPARKLLVLGASLAALTALSACGGPPRPEPAPPPLDPEQAEAELLGAPDEEAYPVDDRPDEDKPDPDGSAYEDEPTPPEMDPRFVPDLGPEPFAMEPVPNPAGEDRFGRPLSREPMRRDRGEPRVEGPRREPAPRDDRAAFDGKPEADEEVYASRADEIGAIEQQAQRDAAGDAGPPPDLGFGRMQPIPNPEPRVRPDAGLRGGPDERLTRAPAPAPTRSAPSGRGASGASVRVPIQPAAPTRPAATAQAASSPPPAVVQAPPPALRGAQPASPPAATPAVSPEQRLAQATEELRRSVERGASLDAPTEWVQGQTREVRLRLPDSLAADLERATAGVGVDGAREVSATLRGDGFRIDPPGPQSAAADATSALAWRVTPESANPGALTATVEASVPATGGERVTIPLGEVDDGRASAGGVSLRTLGWILLVVLGGGLLAWLAGRQGSGGEAAASRRRRRVRAQQRREGYTAFDMSPGEQGGEAPQRA